MIWQSPSLIRSDVPPRGSELHVQNLQCKRHGVEFERGGNGTAANAELFQNTAGGGALWLRTVGRVRVVSAYRFAARKQAHRARRQAAAMATTSCGKLLPWPSHLLMFASCDKLCSQSFFVIFSQDSEYSVQSSVAQSTDPANTQSGTDSLESSRKYVPLLLAR